MIKLFFWNCKGVGNDGFRCAFSQYFRIHKLDIIAIFEPRISGRSTDFVINRLGFEYSHRVEALGFKGGIWLCWNSSLSAEIISISFQTIHVQVTNGLGEQMFLTSVYASPSVSTRKDLWKQLSVICEMVGSAPWLIAGDFNLRLIASDKKGGQRPNEPPSNGSRLGS